MELTGKNRIGGTESGEGKASIRGFDPKRGSELDPAFFEATPREIDEAMRLAAEAFETYREVSREDCAAFLDRIAGRLTAAGDELIPRAAAETGLPVERLTGELGRTTGQIRMFAALVREGSWVDARIDRAQPLRKPLPKPDVRRMLMPVGPVVVFGASNFPLAFSVAGGDTASALAARNPVVVKAHPAHPGASEIAARAIARAVRESGLPGGVFSLLHGADPAVSLALVEHPLTRAVGFTGSLRAGRALFDAAARRPSPIPVYAEMGSVNPVFVLPGAAAERAGAIAQGLRQSVTLGTGQFCTNPGVVVCERADGLGRALSEQFAEAPAATMLHPGILHAYNEGVAGHAALAEAEVTRGREAEPARNEAQPALVRVSASVFLEHERLRSEVFGPCTVLVDCGSGDEMERVARSLEGTLTATIWGTEADLAAHRRVVAMLTAKAGRLIFNGYPTGLEVCAAMHHGGPYPATTDAKFTSVGTAAILRFARPVAFQEFPSSALPEELRDGNPLGIWRTVDGTLTRDE